MANLMLSVMGALAEFEPSLIRNAKEKASPWQNSAVPTKDGIGSSLAAELVQRAGSGVLQALFARDYGISRETVYQYLRHAKLE